MQVNSLPLSKKAQLYSQLSQMHLFGGSKSICIQILPKYHESVIKELNYSGVVYPLSEYNTEIFHAINS